MTKPEGWKRDNKRHWEAKVLGRASSSTEAKKPMYPSKGVKITNLKEGRKLQRNLEDALIKYGFIVYPASRWSGNVWTDKPINDNSRELPSGFEARYITHFGVRAAIKYIEEH
jgi:hypothetical protein